ncbi:hypothetical protein BJV78DRAFT_132894 [Lactifluus subvellereus]|nr:hypothetical protein BJV78DRAFT_132894 [Lactifluus subvellereus]
MDDLIVLNPDASQLTINLFSPDPTSTFVTDTYSTTLSASSPSVFLSKTEPIFQQNQGNAALVPWLRCHGHGAHLPIMMPSGWGSRPNRHLIHPLLPKHCTPNAHHKSYAGTKPNTHGNSVVPPDHLHMGDGARHDHHCSRHLLHLARPSSQLSQLYSAPPL